MPNNIPTTKIGSPPIQLGLLNTTSQNVVGQISTLINVFFTSSNWPITNSLGSFLVYGSSITESSSVDVSDYTTFSFQAATTGSGNATSSISVSSSINGMTFKNEFSFNLTPNTSSVFLLAGNRKWYLTSAHSCSGNITGSLYVIGY